MPAKKFPRSKPAAATAPKPSRVRKTTARKPTASAQPAPTERARGFPIVGIGASAGGLEALDELFAEMPADTGMAFVVITHQHPGHTSLLPELLGKITGIKVLVAADGMRVEPNRVYVSPPGGSLAMLGGTLHRM